MYEFLSDFVNMKAKKLSIFNARYVLETTQVQITSRDMCLNIKHIQTRRCICDEHYDDVSTALTLLLFHRLSFCNKFVVYKICS